MKNKTDDPSGKNNYPPISLTTVVAKVLDDVLNLKLGKILKYYKSSLDLDQDYPRRLGTVPTRSRFACFLDLSKAFDLVCYEILWKKLRNVNLPPEHLVVHQYWYLNQEI